MKKHLWVTLAVIVMLGAAGLVIAQTFSADQPSHGTLFTDLITAKEQDQVTVDDQLVVTGWAGIQGANGLSVTNNATVGGLIVPNGGICVDSDGGCSLPAAGGLKIGAGGISTTNTADGVSINDNLSVNGYIDGKLIGPNGACERLRSDAQLSSDGVQWCQWDKPEIIYCGITDNEAGQSIKDLTTDCSNNGECDMSGSRGDLGGDFIYTEFVKKSSNNKVITGCLAYDLEHGHSPYRIEIVCCR